jgi:hypothetical protein
MPIMQISLTERADKYLRKRVGRSRGFGAFVSQLLVEAETKEHMQRAIERHKAALRDVWDEEANLDSVG